MAFIMRTKAPDKGNKYYIRKQNGGYNPCILGNHPFGAANRTGLAGMNVLPNCVGYATGRFNEIGGYGSCKYLGNTNAKNFISAFVKPQGLKVGQTPKVGACMVWSSGQYGHVAIVEQVISPTEVLVSQSGWSYRGGAMWTAKHKKGPALLAEPCSFFI